MSREIYRHGSLCVFPKEKLSSPCISEVFLLEVHKVCLSLPWVFLLREAYRAILVLFEVAVFLVYVSCFSDDWKNGVQRIGGFGVVVGVELRERTDSQKGQ